MQRQLLNIRGRLRKRELDTRAKAKFDQQIVAISRVENVTTIYSDDEGLAKFASHFGIKTIGIADLPLSLDSADSAQGTLILDPPEPKAPPD
jgi:hypothetical protein